jgi:hypothetical protein
MSRKLSFDPTGVTSTAEERGTVGVQAEKANEKINTVVLKNMVCRLLEKIQSRKKLLILFQYLICK